MIKIKLSRGLVALVDDDCPAGVLGLKWYAKTKPNGHTYAMRSIRLPDGRRGSEYMHRVLTGASHGQHVDHIDGNWLNNQRSNLRVCSNQENVWNSRLHRRNTSGFKGVSWNKQRGGWDARIMVQGEQKHLGTFAHKEAAAAAYDRAAVVMHGGFARTNAAMGLLREGD